MKSACPSATTDARCSGESSFSSAARTASRSRARSPSRPCPQAGETAITTARDATHADTLYIVANPSGPGSFIPIQPLLDDGRHAGAEEVAVDETIHFGLRV